MYSKKDSMYKNEIFFALNCINNHVISSISLHVIKGRGSKSVKNSGRVWGMERMRKGTSSGRVWSMKRMREGTSSGRRRKWEGGKDEGNELNTMFHVITVYQFQEIKFIIPQYSAKVRVKSTKNSDNEVRHFEWKMRAWKEGQSKVKCVRMNMD